jgi:hypothetical protein
MVGALVDDMRAAMEKTAEAAPTQDPKKANESKD